MLRHINNEQVATLPGNQVEVVLHTAVKAHELRVDAESSGLVLVRVATAHGTEMSRQFQFYSIRLWSRSRIQPT